MRRPFGRCSAEVISVAAFFQVLGACTAHRSVGTSAVHPASVSRNSERPAVPGRHIPEFRSPMTQPAATYPVAGDGPWDRWHPGSGSRTAARSRGRGRTRHCDLGSHRGCRATRPLLRDFFARTRVVDRYEPCLRDRHGGRVGLRCAAPCDCDGRLDRV